MLAAIFVTSAGAPAMEPSSSMRDCPLKCLSHRNTLSTSRSPRYLSPAIAGAISSWHDRREPFTNAPLMFDRDFAADRPRSLTLSQGWMLLGVMWVAVTICDRVWLHLDTSVPAWDPADYLRGTLVFWRSLQEPQWLSG
ncbi:MAG: hypothetical protein AAFX40_05030 [Cyanobacteria bacterium J06639_1]